MMEPRGGGARRGRPVRLVRESSELAGGEHRRICQPYAALRSAERPGTFGAEA